MGNLHKLSAHNKKKGGAHGGETVTAPGPAPGQAPGPVAPPMQKVPGPAAPGPAAPAAPAAGQPATENKAPSNPTELKMPDFNPPVGVKVVFDKVDRKWELQAPSTDIGMKLTTGLNEANSFLKNAQDTGINKAVDAATEAKNKALGTTNDILANLTGKVNNAISGGRHTRKHGHKHSGHKHTHKHGRKHKHSGHGHTHKHGRKHKHKHSGHTHKHKHGSKH
jgi:hypothetical protein